MQSFVSALSNSSFTGGQPLTADPSTCPSRHRPLIFRACSNHSENSPASIPATSSIPIPHDLIPATPQLQGEEERDQKPHQTEDETEDEIWYEVVKPVGKTDIEGLKHPKTFVPDQTTASAVDLATLDKAGRELLTGASYDHVVDIDIEEGGVLPLHDEDNNDLFCGVGLDALIESEILRKNLQDGLNIQTATHVQLAAIPRVLDKKDLVIQSHTGTGKTLAFLLPLLDEIEQDRDQVQGIIVAPTRELAMQIFRECDRLCEGTDIRPLALIGGANPARQVDKLRKRQPHIVVGTPGRVAEMVENRELRMHGCAMLVIDEVDQCMQPSFAEDVVYLLRAAPSRVQKVLVSATSDVDSVRTFAGKYLHRPVLLRVGGAQRLPKGIEHWFCVVPARLRIDLLRRLMHTTPPPARAIVFVDDPRRVDMVAERLYQMKIGCGALRGNAHKLERAEVLTAFRKGKVNLLVTTEVAARGLDIPEISHVFNLDLPTDGDHYVHRAGRCGRVGNAGTVVSIATAETAFVMPRLARELGVKIPRMEPRGGKYGEVVERRRSGDQREGAQRKGSNSSEIGERRRERSRERGDAVETAARTHREKFVSKEPGNWVGGDPQEPVTNLRDAPAQSFVSEAGKKLRASGKVKRKNVTQQEEGFKDGILFGDDGITEEETIELLEKMGHPMPKADGEGSLQKERRSVRKTKEKAKSSTKNKVVPKARVKKRLRDTKNKGKPKGRLGRSVESSEEKPGPARASRVGEEEGSDDGKLRQSRVRAARTATDPKVRARREGWVGNR